MHIQSELTSAWREADRMAAVAEHAIFSKTMVARTNVDLPSRAEIDDARSLRSLATTLLEQIAAKPAIRYVKRGDDFQE